MPMMMTEEQHVAEVKALAVPAARELEAFRDGVFADLQRRIEVAVADGVPRSHVPSELTLPGVLMRAHGVCTIDDALARLRATGWLTT